MDTGSSVDRRSQVGITCLVTTHFLQGEKGRGKGPGLCGLLSVWVKSLSSSLFSYEVEVGKV